MVDTHAIINAQLFGFLERYRGFSRIEIFLYNKTNLKISRAIKARPCVLNLIYRICGITRTQLQFPSVPRCRLRPLESSLVIGLNAATRVRHNLIAKLP